MTTQGPNRQSRQEARELTSVEREIAAGIALRFRQQGRAFMAAFRELRHEWDFGLTEAPPDVLPRIGTVWLRVQGNTATAGLGPILSGIDAGVLAGNRQMIANLARDHGIRPSNTRAMRRFLMDILRDDPASMAALQSPLGRDNPVDAILGTADDATPRAKLRRDTPFSLRNLRAESYIRARGAELVRGVDDVTRQGIQRILVQGAEDGRSYSAVARELKSKFEVLGTPSPLKHIRTRAELIAVTETRMAQTYGKKVVSEELATRGVRMAKRWRDIGDERVSDGCQHAVEIWVSYRPVKSFPEGGGDGPPLHPGCRCIMTHRVMARSAA